MVLRVLWFAIPTLSLAFLIEWWRRIAGWFGM
jgi:hypothetical protein